MHLVGEKSQRKDEKRPRNKTYVPALSTNQLKISENSNTAQKNSKILSLMLAKGVLNYQKDI